MSDITNKHRLTAWLPLASLAITTAAYGLGVPTRLARAVHRAPSISTRPSAEPEMRDESALFPLRKTLRTAEAYLPAGAWRGIHEVAGRQFTTSR